jgi:hypothetical protein
VKRIDGVIGTTLFYHFLATLDFPRRELVLRRKNAESLKTFVAESSEDSVAVPFWIASNHFMVGWSRVETMPPALLFVDTGLAGAGVSSRSRSSRRRELSLRKTRLTKVWGPAER